MALYNIYSGLSGGFGGYTYQCTEEFETREEAIERAREMAIEEYESYEGSHGVMNWNDVKEDYLDSEGRDYDDELSEFDRECIDDMYQEAIEGWISYKVTTAEEDPDHDQDCYNDF